MMTKKIADELASLSFERMDKATGQWSDCPSDRVIGAIKGWCHSARKAVELLAAGGSIQSDFAVYRRKVCVGASEDVVDEARRKVG